MSNLIKNMLLGCFIGAFVVVCLLVVPMHCNTLPEKDLHACFMSMTSTSLFGKSIGDSAKMEKCERYHRKELIFLLCGIQIGENGQIIDINFPRKPTKKGKKHTIIENCEPEEILKYIETGAY